jgi:hypothetical protein
VTECLTLSGYQFSTPFTTYQTKLYLQQANRQFSERPNFLQNFANGHTDWADIDHDGDLDLGVGGCVFPPLPEGSCANWWQRQEIGAMRPPQPLLPVVNFSDDFFWQDVDGDGQLDGVAKLSYGNLQVFYGDGQGGLISNGFALPQTTRDGSNLLVDFDRDGDLDAFRSAVRIDNPNPLVLEPSAYYRNDGRNRFVRVQDFPQGLPQYGPTNESVSDLDCDGDLDISLWYSWLPDGDLGPMHWLENDGAGRFTVHEMQFTNSVRPFTVGHFGNLDYDGDGYEDLISYGRIDPCQIDVPCSEILLFRNLGHARYEQVLLPNVQPVDSTGAIYSASDYDGDGRADLLVSGRPGLKLTESRATLYRNDTPRAPVACRLGVIGPAVYQSVPSATAKHHVLLAILIALFGGAVLWNRR